MEGFSKFLGEAEAGGPNCIICCSSPDSSLTEDRRLLFSQFCERFLSFGKPSLWKDLSVCSDCSESMKIALDTRSKMELVERRARKLQLQILQELTEVKMYADLLAWQLGKIERCVKETDTSSSLTPSTGKRGRGRPPRNKVKVQDDHVVHIRKCIANVTNHLHLFRDELKEKVACDTETVVRTRVTSKLGGSGRSNVIPEDATHDIPATLNVPPKSRSTSRQENNFHHQLEDNFDYDDNHDQDDGGVASPVSESGYIESPSTPADASTSPPNYASDNDQDWSLPLEEPTPSKRRRTLLLKKIKSEPVSDPEEDGQDDEDDTKIMEDANPSKSDESANKLKLTWTPITISDETLSRDFKIYKRSQLAKCSKAEYYCGLAQKRQSCPVRISVKDFKDGTRQILQNNRPHGPHRRGIRGIPMEQKAFVFECIRKGITKPSDILLSFRHAGRRGPPLAKLKVFLKTCRQRQKKRDTSRDDPVQDKKILIKENDGTPEDGVAPEVSSMTPPVNLMAGFLDLKSESSSSKPEIKIYEEVDRQEQYDYGEPDDGELCEKCGELKLTAGGNHNCLWRRITISDDKLKEGFRVSKKSQFKGCSMTQYYCAYGAKRQACPVRIKDRLYKNGMRLIVQNNVEHQSHRRHHRGLTKEQKAFVLDCLAKEVTKPGDILNCFQSQALDAPKHAKLIPFLNLQRKLGNLVSKKVDKKKKKTTPGIENETGGRDDDGTSQVQEEGAGVEQEQKLNHEEEAMYHMLR